MMVVILLIGLILVGKKSEQVVYIYEIKTAYIRVCVYICLFHCFTVHFVSPSFIYTNACTCLHVTPKSPKTPFINNPTCFDSLRLSSGISSFISSLSCCYSILKMFKIFIKTVLSCGSLCFVCL